MTAAVQCGSAVMVVIEKSKAGSEAVIVAVNGGSATVKVAAYRVAGDAVENVMRARVDRVEVPRLQGTIEGETIERELTQPVGRGIAVFLRERFGAVMGIAHRVVHGGVTLTEAQRITPAVVTELKRCIPLDRPHLPREIELIEAFGEVFGEAVPQVACFDTEFHRAMPRVAQVLPIPRRYLDAGVRRLGFHGLSYTYLMGELERVAGTAAARGKVILAHLGSGASMAAVSGGRAIDTTMGFTPIGGLVMGTRTGDLDPGLLAYLIEREGLSGEGLERFVSAQCGMAGVSEMGGDMRDLLARAATDVKAGEAVELFCYAAKKWIGALAAALGGVDTLVFSAGIGERSAEVRRRICAGLEFLGIVIDDAKNAAEAALISADTSRVTVRVIATDEETVMVRTVRAVLAR